MTRPPVFRDLGFAEALAESAKSGKFLIVDATAEWCGPCRMMDLATWIDLSVGTWIAEHAVAIQIDVDAHQETAKQLAIHSMPTVIVFENGSEIDRVVGLQKPKQLLAWLEGLKRGESALDAKRKEVADDQHNIEARLEVARMLVGAGKLDEATEDYVWLWENMLEHEPAMYGVRHSFFVQDLQHLVARHPFAHAAISHLRDKVAPSTNRVPSVDAFGDWISLNEALGNDNAAVEWFDLARATLPPTDELSTLVERFVIPALIERGRWKDAGELYANPLETLAKAEQRRQIISAGAPPELNMVAEMVAETIEWAHAHFRRTAGDLVRSLRAAGRTEEANSVESAARQADPSDEMLQALLVQ
jgi:thioredoxin 1